jgi:hypothetical protein
MLSYAKLSVKRLDYAIRVKAIPLYQLKLDVLLTYVERLLYLLIAYIL